jgi:hypothetical protein
MEAKGAASDPGCDLDQVGAEGTNPVLAQRREHVGVDVAPRGVLARRRQASSEAPSRYSM